MGMTSKMEYNYRGRKTVVVLASNLEVGVALNVVGHLCISAGHSFTEELMGRGYYEDQSGRKHKGISRYPIIITKVKPSRLRRLLDETDNFSELLVIDYPREMFETGHDDELADAIRATLHEKMDYLGVLIHGKSETVDSLTGKFMLWR